MSDDKTISGDPPHGRFGRVLNMVDFDQGNPARIMSELKDYWRGLRQDRAVPQRSDVEPLGIGRALDYAFILERVAPGAARFRLAGRHLIDLMGMEVRGMPLCSFLNPPSRGRLSDVLETVFRAPQLAELNLEAKADYARPAMTARMLLMPLRSDLGDVTRALGCLIAEGELGAAPRRFDLVQDRIIPVFDGAETMAPLASPAAAQGFGESGNDWQPNKRKRRQPPAEAVPLDARTVTGSVPPSRAEFPETPEERRARFRIVIRND